MIFRVIIDVFKPSKESNDVVAVKVGRKISKQLLTGKIGNILVVPEAIKLRGLYIFILLLFHELKRSVLNINGVCSTIERGSHLTSITSTATLIYLLANQTYPTYSD